MNYFIIPLTSVTAAKRLEKEALSKGIVSRVVNTPKGLSERGCSHSIRFRETDVKRLIELGKMLELGMGGVFKELKNGRSINYIRQEQFNDLF